MILIIEIMMIFILMILNHVNYPRQDQDENHYDYHCHDHNQNHDDLHHEKAIFNFC